MLCTSVLAILCMTIYCTMLRAMISVQANYDSESYPDRTPLYAQRWI